MLCHVGASEEQLVKLLFPHLALVVVEEVGEEGEAVVIRARTAELPALCPGCDGLSAQVHTRYERILTDVAVGGRAARIRLTVRRMRCATVACGKKTFAEQVDGLTVRHGRRTVLAQQTLAAIAIALAGRAGARLCRALRHVAGRSTLLRLLRKVLLPPVVKGPRVLGVDDFALRRGHVYATVLLDMETHRPIDVLADRTSATFAAWLQAHPGVEIICRDRAGAFAEGARVGAPQALQVADSWHVWDSLGEAVEKTVIAHHCCVKESVAVQADPSQHVPDAVTQNLDRTLDVYGQPRRLVARTRQRYAVVQEALAQGLSLGQICRQLNLDRTTVWRFARAKGIDELLVEAANRPSKLDRFKPYLHERWNDGVTSAGQLLDEIRANGYHGSVLTVRRYLHQLPWPCSSTAPDPVALKPRRVARWLMSDPEHLKAEEALGLRAILACCPHLDAVAGHIREFAVMLLQLRGERLAAWLDAVQADDLPFLNSLVIGIRRDLKAVAAGLTLPWNSGPVEGQVNRIKMLKRTMFGRANLDLLRRRILLTT